MTTGVESESASPFSGFGAGGRKAIAPPRRGDLIDQKRVLAPPGGVQGWGLLAQAWRAPPTCDSCGARLSLASLPGRLAAAGPASQWRSLPASSFLACGPLQRELSLIRIFSVLAWVFNGLSKLEEGGKLLEACFQTKSALILDHWLLAVLKTLKNV